ncbi:hypothetical protein [Bacillus sp. SM2101]|uniref:hypothetical protein n=1 Tax=Bacillus sp. SM2101 TaxID=2805366 RepID=UPI001BDEC016|nr:hypothetical protein [Bacillus sp. SM2101]
MSINQEAIRLLEGNEYENSLKLFKKAVDEARDVQSLTNLAWIYCYEEYKDNKALILLDEVISLNPSSHFPYNLYGEILLRQEKWIEAKGILLQSINIKPTINANYNLAVACYHLGEIEKASRYFLLGSESSDYAMYSYVYCLIRLGETKIAIETLGKFKEDDDEFVGEIEVADLYLELEMFDEAAKWFEKGWKRYSKDVRWVSRFIYTLLKLNRTDFIEIFQEVIKEKEENIKEESNEECDEDWTEEEKQDYITELITEKAEFEQMYKKFINGFIPVMEFDTSVKTGCYLFGCKRHNHPEYQEL